MGRGSHFQGQRGVWVAPGGLGGMELLGRLWGSMEAINQESTREQERTHADYSLAPTSFYF